MAKAWPVSPYLEAAWLVCVVAAPPVLLWSAPPLSSAIGRSASSSAIIKANQSSACTVGRLPLAIALSSGLCMQASVWRAARRVWMRRSAWSLACSSNSARHTVTRWQGGKAARWLSTRSAWCSNARGREDHGSRRTCCCANSTADGPLTLWPVSSIAWAWGPGVL